MRKNNVYLMDVIDFLKEVENNSIDLAVIDPPYNQSIDEWDTFESESEYFKFVYSWLDLTLQKINENGSIYLFNNALNSSVILNYLRKKGFIFKNWIVWNKKDGFSPSKKKYVNNQEVILFFTKSEKYTFNSELIRVPYESSERMLHAEKKGILKNGKRWYPNKEGKLCSDVWLFSSDRHSRKQNGKTVKLGHPTPKPEKLIERIILASSNEGNTVLDLFSGSGTTSYVAKKLNRSFLAVENNIKYFKLIKERLKI